MANAATTREDPVKRIVKMVDQRADQFQALLGPDPLVWERFRTVALHAVTSDAKLLEADPLSVLEAIRDSATLGLEPNGLLGEGHIVTYRDGKSGRLLAQFQPGWQGLLKLARESGLIRSVGTGVVYERDSFDLTLGTDAALVHRPWLQEDRGGYVGAYAFAVMASGDLEPEWMPWSEVEMVRKQSKSADRGPWVQWPGEMARKSVLRRLLKRLPRSKRLDRALELEQRLEAEDRHPPKPVPRAIARIHERLGIAPGTVEPQPESFDDDPGPDEGTCGSASDDALGPVVTCDLTAAHPGVHRHGDERTWPR